MMKISFLHDFKCFSRLSLCVITASLAFVVLTTKAGYSAENIPSPAAPTIGAVEKPQTTSEKSEIVTTNENSGAIIEAPSVGVSSGETTETAKTKRIPSIFFTYWQHQSILDALQSMGNASSFNGDEFLTDEEKKAKKEDVPIKPENREVFLSGIVYVHSQDWTIWLNGKRLTPDSVLPEIIDLKVYKSYIDVKWYDEYSNKIFPIRIRPHQRFNLDTRVFLPG